MDPVAALLALIQSTGFVNVQCATTEDPKVVRINLPAYIAVTLPYETYEQIREEAGLPDDICN